HAPIPSSPRTRPPKIYLRLIPTPPRSTLFPYTTLFRSQTGLAEGERVVTSANFLVDSESRLRASLVEISGATAAPASARVLPGVDRKSTRLNSSHLGISYAVFCLKKKKQNK